MKTQLTILHNGSRTRAMTEPVSGSQSLLALLMRLLWAAVLLMPALGAQAAVVFTSLYSFESTTLGPYQPFPDGRYPIAALVQGTDGSFYGTTPVGGTTNLNYNDTYGSYGCGTVFKISPNGTLTTLYRFGLVQDTNGVPLDGESSSAALVQGSDGYFYGTTYNGGTNNFGTVFKISTNGAFTSLYSFGSIQDTNGNPVDGIWPLAKLVQGSDGNFYGTTCGVDLSGDRRGNGTVFKISTNGALTSLYSFTGINDGANPHAGLVQGSDGSFYGTTSGGGTNGAGTVFKISTNGRLTTLYAFTGGNYGGGPNELVQGSDGNFYGTTGGGTNDAGTVFKISTNGALTTLFSFNRVNLGETNGVNCSPQAGFVQGTDGYFYGTTKGMDGEPPINYQVWGTVFRISTNGALTTLYSFTGGNDGRNPQAGLVQGSDGSFYGTTTGGQYGSGTFGTVFRLTIVPDPQLTVIPSGPYVILTWPTNQGAYSFAGYTLQSTTNLGPAALWTPVSPSPVVIGGEKLVVSTMTGTQQFFRLSQ